MRVALVDDNKNDLALLHEYISEQTAHSCQIDTFSSGESFLSCWQMGAYDLVVLDIFMGKMTGIEVAEKLRETDKNVNIAFGTSSNEFASESYELNACYYLCKPFQADKVKAMLALYPFRHRLRFSKTATVGLVVALSLVQIFLGWQAAFFSTNAGLLSAVSTLLYAAFYFFAVKVKVGKTGFTLLLLSNNASFIVITSKCLEGILFPSLAYESYRWSFSLCMLMTEAVVWGPLFIYMKKVYTPAVEREPSGLEWRYLWLIPFTFYIIWYYTLYGNSTKSSLELALEPKNTIALFFINAGAFLVYYIVARLVIEQQKNLRLQENNHLLEMQNLQYDYLQDKIKETRRYKHDVRHHIALMQELLKKGEYDKLSEYLNSFRDSMPDISERIYCKNTSVSALLAYFAQIAESSGIEYKVSADIPDDIKIDITDLSVLFGNLIENAIHGCVSDSAKNKKIIIRAKADSYSLCLAVDNTFTGTILTDPEGGFLSSKRKGKGIGTESVKNIAAKYNGVAKFEYGDGMFYASVMLNI